MGQLAFSKILRLSLIYGLSGLGLISGSVSFSLCGSSNDPTVVGLNYFVANWTSVPNGVYAGLANSNLSQSHTSQAIIMGGSGASNDPVGNGTYSPLELSQSIPPKEMWSNNTTYLSASNVQSVFGSRNDYGNSVTYRDFFLQCSGDVNGFYGLWFSVQPTSNFNFAGMLSVSPQYTSTSASISIVTSWFYPQNCGSSSDKGPCSSSQLNATVTGPIPGPGANAGDANYLPRTSTVGFQAAGTGLEGMLGSWLSIIKTSGAGTSGQITSFASSNFPIASLLGPSINSHPSIGNNDAGNDPSLTILSPYAGGMSLWIPSSFDFQEDFYGVVHIGEYTFAYGDTAMSDHGHSTSILNQLEGYGSQIASGFAIVCENITGMSSNCPWLGSALPQPQLTPSS